MYAEFSFPFYDYNHGNTEARHDKFWMDIDYKFYIILYYKIYVWSIFLCVKSYKYDKGITPFLLVYFSCFGTQTQ
jgi:hypothetical protein